MNDSKPVPPNRFTITCTDQVKPICIPEFVYEAFGKFDALNKQKRFTYKQYDFPDEQIISAMQNYIATMIVGDTITCMMEFDHLNNRVEVFCTYPNGQDLNKEYKAVKVYSGRWLKPPTFAR